MNAFRPELPPVRSLRRKTLLWLALGLTVAVGVIIALCGRVVMEGFLDLEQRLTVRNFERVREAIWHETETLGMKVNDWAVWDDTFRFLARPGDEDHDPAWHDQYVKSNLHDEALGLLGIQAVVFFDRDGKRYCERATDGVDINAPAFSAAIDRVGRESVHRPMVGPLAGGGVVALVAARPVLMGDGGGPSRGSLVFVRVLDRDLVHRLETVTHTRFGVSEPFDRTLTERVDVRNLDEHRASARGGLSGIWGPPVATLEVFKPREVAAQGSLTVRAFNLALIAAALSFGLLSVLGLGRLVLSRIEQLGQDVSCVADARSASRRVRAQGNDELGGLASTINEMLAALDQNAAELKARNSELAHARDAADAANRAKSSFLANMSHEIRTPMAAITGFADLLLDPEQTPEDRVDCVQTIRRNAEHLLGLINDILDLSKIEAGKMTVERVQCDLPDIVRGVIAVAQVKASAKRIALAAEFRPEVPMRVTTDPMRLTQILVNLVGNAVKFTEHGGVRLIVGAERSGETSVLRFDVLDTGIGMTPGQVHGLFRPFEQADVSTTRKFGGTGLGLTISRDLARALGGDIRVTSSPGEGSTFTLTIEPGNADGRAGAEPDRAAAQTGAVYRPAEPSTPSGPTDAGVRVLVAEDGPDNQRLLSFHLRRAGAEVEIVSNGREAVERATDAAARGTPFDLVLMDMQMPVLDGYSATSLLRQQGYPGRIVALTANAMKGDRDKCIQVGCDDYLPKPVEAQRLLALVDSARTGGVLPPMPAAA
jgi:signal transduction histidine kinase/ActR/RegA family two-component response regulator